MAVFKGVIRSEALEMDTSLNVILPYDRPFEDNPKPCRVLYLLHGLSDNCDAWLRYTNIERYVRDYKLAVVMPEVQRSFYTDMAHGLKYFTYVADELPLLCRRMFNLSGQREDTFVAGLSMGGYGAMKCLLSHPDRYAGGASFSGALDIFSVINDNRTGEFANELKAAFGMDFYVDSRSDLKALAVKLADSPTCGRPKIFITCGYDDFLYEDNIAFKKHLDGLKLDYRYDEWPGEHEWGFWDKSIQLALNYFLATASGRVMSDS